METINNALPTTDSTAIIIPARSPLTPDSGNRSRSNSTDATRAEGYRFLGNVTRSFNQAISAFTAQQKTQIEESHQQGQEALQNALEQTKSHQLRPCAKVVMATLVVTILMTVMSTNAKYFL